MTKRLAIILARSGSKRIKNKNFKIFYGKPMILYPLNELKKSKIFDEIHVSTELKKKSNLLKKYKFEPSFLRPLKLSTDRIPSIEVIIYVLKKFLKMGKVFDEVWNISACSPFLNKSDIIKAASIFLKQNKKKALISVTEYSAPIEWAFEYQNKKLKPLWQEKMKLPSSNMKKKFYDCNIFSIFDTKNILKYKRFYNYNNFIPYFYKKNSVVDIDTVEDWNCAKKLYERKKSKK